MYVYGGYDGRSVFSDIHRLNTKTLQWEVVETSGRRPASMVGLMPGAEGSWLFCAAPAGIVVGNKVIVMAEEFEKASTAIYVLYLRAMRWQRCVKTFYA